MPRYAAYCGLYCGACCSMIIHEKQAGEESALQMETPQGEQPCAGCDAPYQQNCEFIVCNKNHGTESCAFCPEYPCERIIAFSHEEWEHHEVVLNNLNRIKEVGIEQWLQEQKEYWKCPSCGFRTQWYQKQCPHCNAEITNYK